MRLVLWILSLLVGCVIAGCQGDRDVDNALLCADEMMEKMPDLALKVMESIDPKRVYGGSQRARYALLLTQARYKNFIDETDDSLISVAVRHYRRKNDHRALANACFHKARILENAGNDNRSLELALDAEQAAIKADDNLWLARIYELMADLYEANYNIPEALKYRKLAVSYYQKCNNTQNCDWALVDLAITYNEMHDSISNRRCILLLDSIRDVCINAGYSDHFWHQCYISYISAFYRLGQNEKAIEKFRELERLYPNQIFPSQVYAYISRCFVDLDLDSAKVYYEKSLSAPSQNILSEQLALYSIYRKQNNFREALSINLKISAIQDSIAMSQARQSLSVERSNYFVKVVKKEQYISKRRKVLLIAGLIFGAILLGIIYLYHNERMLRKNAELSVWIDKFKNLSKDLSESNSNNEELSRTLNEILNEINIVNEELNNHKKIENELNKTIKQLFGSHFESLNLLCEEYIEKKDSSDKVKLTIFKSIKKEIDRMSDSKNFEKLENIVNSCNNNILSRFKEQFREMSPINLSFITLSFAGLSPQAISLILKISLSNCYTKKHRLKEQIKRSQVKDRDEFLEYL